MTAEVTQLRAALTEHGVTGAAQEALVDKHNAGVPWDSMSGEEPVSVSTETANGYKVTTERYEDGSLIEHGIEIGKEAFGTELAEIVASAKPFLADDYDGDHAIKQSTAEFTTMAQGIDNCRYGYNGGVRYANGCHVYYHGISASNSFDANYQQWSGGSSAQYISGTAKFVSLTITVSNERVNVYDGGTRIRYDFNTALAGWGNIPGYLQLKVTSTGTSVTAG